jgi:hypothetical protein
MRRQSLGAMGSVASIAILLLLVQPVAAVTTFSISVGTDASSYVGAHQVKVTGSVTPAPGPNTAVFVRVISPNKTIVVLGSAAVNATSGAFEFDFVAGGTTAWVTGIYTVNATWGAYPPTVSRFASFAWAPATATTITTTNAASQGNVLPGTLVKDNVSVTAVPSDAGTPTGSVQFYFCGALPSAKGCNNSGTSVELVSLSGGKAQSAAQAPDKVGFYCFAAYYKPNTPNFLPSNSTAAVHECFQVVAPTATTTTLSSQRSVPPNTAVNDMVTVVTLSSGAGTPTGSVQFYICGPLGSASGCTVSGALVGSPAIVSGGTAKSPNVSELQEGFYCFAAYYTPDTTNFLASNSTIAALECFQVLTPTTSNTSTSSTIASLSTSTNSSTTASSPSGGLSSTVIVAAVAVVIIAVGTGAFLLRRRR